MDTRNQLLLFTKRKSKLQIILFFITVVMTPFEGRCIIT